MTPPPEGTPTGGAAPSAVARPSQHTARVITCSDRAARGEYSDRSGPVAVAWLRARGFGCDEAVIVPDGSAVTDALRTAIAQDVVVVVTTGGTGLGPRDLTPEATAQVVQRLVPGVADAIRAAGVAQGVTTAVLSRGIVGLAGRTLIVNLPGSVGGVRDGLTVLDPLLDHMIDQVMGGDH